MKKILRYFVFILIFSFLFQNVSNCDYESNSNSLPPKVYCRYAIAMDSVTGRVLYEKNAYIKTPMASTTKIMTAILAIEKTSMNDVVTVSERAARVGGSTINLQKGEKILLYDLLYGLMLNSGNDAAIAVAEHIGGTVENFAKMMTEKAHQLGAFDTAFVTPHGLDRDGHYTTAFDLALITKYALQNKDFSRIVRTSQATISGPNNTTRHLYNTNEMLDCYAYSDGVKTGYTGKAGRCLVTSATKNNWRIISVVLGSDSRSQRSADSTKILDYVFNNYNLMDLTKLIKIKKNIKVIKGREDILKISTEKSIVFPLNEDEISQLSLSYDLPLYLEAPITKGTKIGKASYNIGSFNCASVDLYAEKDIGKKTIGDYYREILEKLVEEYRLKAVLR